MPTFRPRPNTTFHQKKSTPHLEVFQRKFMFCLEKVTELPAFTVFRELGGRSEFGNICINEVYN